MNGWNLEETVAHLRKEAVVSFCNLFPVNLVIDLFHF